MDTVSPVRRSEIMRLVRGKDTKLEKSLENELEKRGYRFQTHLSKLPGKPDIVFQKKKVAVFIDSCFWHGCKMHCRLPSTNRSYWKKKIERNRQRDKVVNKELKALDWTTVRVWEHSIKKTHSAFLRRLQKKLSAAS